MMKTNFLKTILLASIALFFANCSKDDDKPAPTANPEVNPLAGYLSATGFSEQTADVVNFSNFEFGLSFMPTVNGRITALVVKIPDVNAALRMTIWNKTTATVLKTEIINYATAGVEVTTAIAAVNLTAGTEYMVTVNSNDWYVRERFDQNNTTYPLLIGNLAITGYLYKSGSVQALPTSQHFDYYGGDISFKFQKS